MHNNQSWAAVNPHSTRSNGRQQNFSINAWVEIIHDSLIGLYLFPDCLDEQKYPIFLQQMLPDLLQHVKANVRGIMRFWHGVASVHFSRNETAFRNRQIGRRRPVSCPPRSPDLPSLDFCLWGQLKDVLCEAPITSPKNLVAELPLQLQTFLIYQE